MPIDLSHMGDVNAVAEDSFYFVRYEIDGASQTRRLHRSREQALEDIRLYYANLKPELFQKVVKVYPVPFPEDVKAILKQWEGKADANG